jgi:hypothetical protein
MNITESSMSVRYNNDFLMTEKKFSTKLSFVIFVRTVIVKTQI